MNEVEIINKLQEVFTPVAQKIGEGANFGWEVVVRQQIANGIVDLMIAIFGIILGIGTYKFVRFAMKKHDESSDRYNDWNFCASLVGTIGGIATSFMVICGTMDGILHLINPAYYAIEFFIGLVK